NNFYRFEAGLTAASKVQATIIGRVGGSDSTLAGPITLFTYSPGTFYRMKIQTSSTSPTTLRMKIWPDGTTEPTAWSLETTNNAAALQTTAPIALFGGASSATN